MRRIRVVAALCLMMMLAGCGIVPGVGPDPRIEAQPVAAVTCPETYEDGYAEPGLVPPDFTAAAVLRCDPDATWEDTDGTWTGARLERLEGDLGPVLAALATPSDPRSLGACSAVGYVFPELWVEDVGGNVVRVAIPTTGCGAPKDVGLDSALNALTVTEDTFTTRSLVE
ncbi:hypothetical protein FHX49_002060 [Microbacterium endophyticum]|uniref:DUF3515 domain-containing protein n=1 Tax=Microbacterium endophyticum TaxID=1526412 RepID=A0A7W4V463_9MICO|nr:hypothetical protein [Microbacterium endophyticum]MBB2976485.1 hypothetical protein [Microbacterium endophyticum]NIK35931.1 hypothetical protein [Microbacterium endophyticum]